MGDELESGTTRRQFLVGASASALWQVAQVRPWESGVFSMDAWLNQELGL